MVPSNSMLYLPLARPGISKSHSHKGVRHTYSIQPLYYVEVSWSEEFRFPWFLNSLCVLATLRSGEIQGTFHFTSVLDSTTKCFVTQYPSQAGSDEIRTIVEFYTNDTLTGIVSVLFHIPKRPLDGLIYILSVLQFKSKSEKTIRTDGR